MQRRLYILVWMIACIFGFSLKIQAQPQSRPLVQCIGSKAIFAVGGDSLSTFRYSITGGEFLDTSKHDSLVVKWDLEEGLHRIGVQEIAYGGCEGEWVYMYVDLVGERFIPGQTSHVICADEEIEIKVDPQLFKIIRWSDEEAVVDKTDTPRGVYHITKPGTFNIYLEDVHGCKHTETFEVTLCPEAVKQKP